MEQHALFRAALPKAWLRIAPGAAACALVVSVGLADGGILPRAWRLATLALCVLAAAALVSRERIVVSRLEWCVLAAFAVLAAWTAASTWWSARPAVSTLQAERVVVYALALLVAFLLTDRSSLLFLLGGILAGVTLVSAYGLLAYLFWPPPLDPYEGRLLYEPLGYPNAFGLFAAVGILLAVGLGWHGRGVPVRALALAPVAVLGPVLYLTSSRGALPALGAGLVLLACFASRSRAAVPAFLAAVALVVIAALLAVAVRPRTLAQLAGRDRAHYWSVAWKNYKEHPYLGSGAGTYGVAWLAHRPDLSVTRTAHSLYLQTLAELGPPGLLLVLAALGLPFVALRTRGDPLAGVAAAAYLAFVLHAGIDWDWELPAVGLAGLLAGAALPVRARSEGSAALGVPLRAVLAAAALGLAVVALVRLGSGPRLPFGP